MEQFKPGIYIARDSKKVKYGGEDEGSWLSKYSFVEPEDFEKVASKLKSGKTGDRPIYTKLKTYHKDIWSSIQKNFGIKEEKFSLSDIIEIQEEVVIKQDGKKIILEKGDEIQVLDASFNGIPTEDEVLFSSEGQSEDLQDQDSSEEYFDEPIITYSNVWDSAKVSELISEVAKYNDILKSYESGIQFQKNLRFISNAVKNLSDYIIGFN